MKFVVVFFSSAWTGNGDPNHEPNFVREKGGNETVLPPPAREHLPDISTRVCDIGERRLGTKRAAAAVSLSLSLFSTKFELIGLNLFFCSENLSSK